jgi:hypothetical protein
METCVRPAPRDFKSGENRQTPGADVAAKPLGVPVDET